MNSLANDSIDSIPTASSVALPISSSSAAENGVTDEKIELKEEQEPSSHSPTMEPEVVFSIEFSSDALPDTFHTTLGDICRESCIAPRSAQLFPSRESSTVFYLALSDEDSSPMSWKGLNSLVTVSRVDYRHIESLLDRKNIISIFDLPNFDMGGSEVLAGLERDVQKLSVVDHRDSSPIPADPRPAKADPVTVKRALIVTILKDEMKTEMEEKMRGLANDACFDTNVKDAQAVIDPLCDDHFFLLFIRPSHILDNIALIRRGLLQDQVTVRKVVETTPVVQDRFLELVADSSRCFPVEVKKREKEEKRSRGTVNSAPLKSIIASNGVVTPKGEPSTPPSDETRKARGPTSGHVARRLVEGSLGIRSTVTREQVKKENALVATFAVMTHVRFGEVTDRTDIHVETTADNEFFVNLGFLQDQHIYAIHLPIPVVTSSMERHLVSPQGDLPVESVIVKSKDGKTELELEIKLDGVHGQVQSRVTLDSISPKVVLVFRASVLKSHDGTPSLKSGISIVARLDNDDSSSVASGAPVPCK